MPGRRGTGTRRFPCSLQFVRRSRSPALSRRHRHGYAAGIHRDLPGQRPRPPGSSRRRRSAAVRTAPGPYPPGLSRWAITGPDHAGSSRTPLLLARRTRPIWQYWHVPALSGLLPPSPAPPGSGCPQLQRPAATGRRRRSSTSTRITAPHGAHGPQPSRRLRKAAPVLPSATPNQPGGLRENHQRPNETVLTPCGGHDIPAKPDRGAPRGREKLVQCGQARGRGSLPPRGPGAISVKAGAWPGRGGRMAVGCPHPNPGASWHLMPYPSLARGLDPEGSRIVAASTPVSFSLPTGAPRAARPFPSARARGRRAAWSSRRR
jgi:hypothetical protein